MRSMSEILDQHRTLSVAISGGLVQEGPDSGVTEVDRQGPLVKLSAW